MNRKLKKNLIEYGIMGVIFAVIFATGTQAEVFGFLQRGLLEVGLMKPDVEEAKTSSPTHRNPDADFNLQLRNAEGELVSLEEYRGKVIFLNIWATWCPPCVAEMPGINKLYKEVEQEGIVFLMVSVDQDFQKAVNYSRKKGYSFEVFSPAGGLPASYSSESIPTTYVIDTEGKLVLTHIGMGDYDNEEFKEFLLNQK